MNPTGKKIEKLKISKCPSYTDETLTKKLRDIEFISGGELTIANKINEIIEVLNDKK